MKLWLLETFCRYISCPQKIYTCKRIDDNVLLLLLNDDSFEIDFTRGRSSIRFVETRMFWQKNYSAPFDLKLKKLNNAILQDIKVDGQNRILHLFIEAKNAYKKENLLLELEFTGRHTNMILLDENHIVLGALRFNKRVRNGEFLSPLPQPDFVKPSSSARPINSKKELKDILDAEFVAFRAQELQNQKEQILKNIDSKIMHFQKLINALPSAQELQAKAEVFNGYAHAIFSNIHNINTFYEDLELDGLKIAWLPRVNTSSALAQEYFALAKKHIQKANNIHLESKNLQEHMDFLNTQRSLIKSAKTLQDLKIFYNSNQRKQKHKRLDYEVFFIDGFKIGIGKNARQNGVLLKEARAQDLWLHIADIPSSHMIIFCSHSKLSIELIEKAAQILAGLQGAGKYRIDYTRRKFVKIIAPPAFVNYAKYESLEIRID